MPCLDKVKQGIAKYKESIDYEIYKPDSPKDSITFGNVANQFWQHYFLYQTHITISLAVSIFPVPVTTRIVYEPEVSISLSSIGNRVGFILCTLTPKLL